MKKWRYLNTEEKRVIENKGTEPPFSGKYDNFYEKGVYVCKRCGAPLFISNDKFDAGCGWPSFDDALHDALILSKDADGLRTEVTCRNCHAHLGHVFKNENLTSKNTRYCINSISLIFNAENEKK